MEILNGIELLVKYPDSQNNTFAKLENIFKLETINKKNFNSSLATLEDWEENENADFHIEKILNMVTYLKSGNMLPPIIVDLEGFIIEGMHRITAYNLVNFVIDIPAYLQIK